MFPQRPSLRHHRSRPRVLQVILCPFLICSSSSNTIPVVTPENIDSLILEPIPQCSVYTNNPYHESGGVNDLLPTGAIYTKLKGQAFICKECNSGFLPTLDRTQCLAPTVKSNCKSYTNVECRECSSGFSRQKNLFREVVSEQNQSEFDRESFFLNFFEFANEVILLDPSQNPHLTKNFDECKSRSFLPNCKVAESLNVCRVCADGHFLDSSFRCQPNPSRGSSTAASTPRATAAKSASPTSSTSKARPFRFCPTPSSYTTAGHSTRARKSQIACSTAK